MPTHYPLFQVDVFTRERFTGNAAGVVLDAEGLSDAQMQAIARELNNSETAFVLAPEADDHDVRVRFFTPTTEVPSCGHATLAAHYVRAREGRIAAGRIRHKIGIGVLPIDVLEVEGEGGGGGDGGGGDEGDDTDFEILMTQGEIEFGPELDGPQRRAVLEALGVEEGEVDSRAPLQAVSTGHGKILVPLRHRGALHALAPDLDRLAELSPWLGQNGYFVFTLDAEDPSILAHGRMFAPAIGIAEDPVTGNGNGPLGAYLLRHGLAEASGDRFSFRARQGEAMGRPGEARVMVELDGGEPVRVQVGGRAVVVFRTEIEG